MQGEVEISTRPRCGGDASPHAVEAEAAAPSSAAQRRAPKAGEGPSAWRDHTEPSPCVLCSSVACLCLPGNRCVEPDSLLRAV